MMFLDDFVFHFQVGTELNKINVILQLLSVIGLIKCYRQRHIPLNAFVLVITLGIFVSISFIPPWDAGMRPYMATVPMISIVPALGVAALAQKLQWRRLLIIPQSPTSSSLLWVAAVLLSILTIGGGITTKLLSQPPQLTLVSCGVNSQTVYFRNSQGSSIYLVDDKAVRQTNIPKIPISHFRTILERYQQKYAHHPSIIQITKELSKLSPNTTITNKINLKDGNMIWIISPDSILN
ncbi:hypothetical protein VB715_17985 [Crocosphaera sp. UHCC 0190]|uniref:hypothetical protein n=1 Tax=Crocosphaera sp. UHCC 0190 TaxID=3110246 RepID=UPI002B2156D2|nr:hypothetical protein [Crocosphaera sp. UHCC 0190]MEA5511667.1 hypothetical protein [Crocosphaera sp. UHCC 0190]